MTDLEAFYAERFGDPSLPNKLAADVYAAELAEAIRTATGPIDLGVVRARAAERLTEAFYAVVDAELEDEAPAA